MSYYSPSFSAPQKRLTGHFQTTAAALYFFFWSWGWFSTDDRLITDIAISSYLVLHQRYYHFLVYTSMIRLTATCNKFPQKSNVTWGSRMRDQQSNEKVYWLLRIENKTEKEQERGHKTRRLRQGQCVIVWFNSQVAILAVIPMATVQWVLVEQLPPTVAAKPKLPILFRVFKLIVGLFRELMTPPSPLVPVAVFPAYLSSEKHSHVSFSLFAFLARSIHEEFRKKK